MNDCEFEKIIMYLMVSFGMENIIIPKEVVSDMKNRYVTNVVDNEKKLVKSRGAYCYDNRRK